MGIPVSTIKGVARGQYPHINTTTPKARTPFTVKVNGMINTHVKSR